MCLFQVDITRSIETSTISKNVIDELQEAMNFLNKITCDQKNVMLNQFQQAFYDRYEEREIPLLEALDFEIGIGYPVYKGGGTDSPLLEDFFYLLKEAKILILMIIFSFQFY